MFLLCLLWFKIIFKKYNDIEIAIRKLQEIIKHEPS